MGEIEGQQATVYGRTDVHIAHKRIRWLQEPLLRERLLAEFVGTFFLMLTICMSVAGANPVAPVAIGLTLGVQIFTFGSVSGAFFNPAVTFAVLLSGRGKISGRDTVLYILVQCLGAIGGAFSAFVATDSTFSYQYTDWGASLALETVFTMMLCGAVLATGTSNDAPNHYFGFAIGLSVTAGGLASGGFNQGSFNPAVTLAANVANLINEKFINEPVAPQTYTTPSFLSWLLFLGAPLLGGILAAGLFLGTRSNEYEYQGLGAQRSVDEGLEEEVTEAAVVAEV